MYVLKVILVFFLFATLSACGNIGNNATLNAPFEAPAFVAEGAEGQPQTLPITVRQINIDVPSHLKVSEANSYYPRGDIVWRGDPLGDRHAQIKAVMAAGFQAGTADMNGDTDVIIDIEVVRWHSVTEKVRYSVGGVHNIVFNITLRDATTGEALAPKRLVQADLPAFGGRAALAADIQGQTQKVRLVSFLSRVIQQETSRFIVG